MKHINNRVWFGVLLCLIFLSSGCSRLFNPYSSEFSCPDPYKGTCQATKDSYKDSLSGADQQASETFRAQQASNPEPKPKRDGEKDCTKCSNGTSKGCNNCSAQPSKPSEEALYKKELFSKLTSLIEEPRTPIVVPPDVMRILLLGYTGDENELFSHRYIYIFTNEPRWIIDPSDEPK